MIEFVHSFSRTSTAIALHTRSTEGRVFYIKLLFYQKTVPKEKAGYFVDPAYDPGGVGVKNPDVGVYIYSGVLTPPGSGSRKLSGVDTPPSPG